MPPAEASSDPRSRVALDAMGGDHAPGELVRGALQAADAGVSVVLVGASDVVAGELAEAGRPDELPIVDAPDVVGMDEEPALALRSKPGASVRVAAELTARGDAGAMVSAGSTGATLAAALLTAGRVPGVRRPAVAALLPFGDGVILIDAGGSPDVQAEALVIYARMGAAYARARGVQMPRIGLLNVGEEPGKGNALAREAFALLQDAAGFSDGAFAGNVEPPAVLAGGVDVVVTDGFTGNVLLKTVEAAGSARASGPGAGAAVLVGVATNVLVAHGAARADEVAAALRTAADVAQADLAGAIARQLDTDQAGVVA